MSGWEEKMRATQTVRDTTSQQAVKAWLAKDLAARYDATLSETLPPDLLALLRD